MHAREGVDLILVARQAGQDLQLALDAARINASIDRDRSRRVSIALSADDAHRLASMITSGSTPMAGSTCDDDPGHGPPTPGPGRPRGKALEAPAAMPEIEPIPDEVMPRCVFSSLHRRT